MFTSEYCPGRHLGGGGTLYTMNLEGGGGGGGGGQCSQVKVLSREIFGGKGDTVHHEWSHYFTMDNIVHVGGQEMQNSSSWYCLFVPSLSNHGNRRSYSEKLNSRYTGIAI